MLPLKDNVPTRAFPAVTVALIAANVIVWLWEWQTGVEKEVVHYGYYPCSVEGPCVAPAATVDHLPWFVGAFTLDVHARQLGPHRREHALPLDLRQQRRGLAGPRRASSSGTCSPAWPRPRRRPSSRSRSRDAAGASIPNIGASGAIAGVLGAYFVLLPRRAC